MNASQEDELLNDIRKWSGLVRVGIWSAVVSVALIALQIVFYVIWPPPETAAEFLELLTEEPVQGLLALDLLYPLSNLLTFFVYLALAVVLWRVSRSAVAVALAFGTLGMAAYMASPRPVEMLQLAQLYSAAGPTEQTALLAVAEGMLATWTGTAFDVYYVLNFAALLVFASLMFRSPVFGRPTAVWGLLAAILMAVPSNFGTVGLVFALASLLPWSVFAVLVARRLSSLLAEAR
ncbi:DUF4386 family protein [Gulosibacter molinativorax]|uniref:DUF4386 domain-containing protein n=1 Tax=Gulosibacter molinativorax TaxID=256821 RepID=A0ABT7CC82_9MICO|nr:DUF4386 family protein [Gulosibacter molinativorax]MDJ1372404.1 hypothetical protein [Gulosibacter molinativorax]QUY61122.1 Hypothetical protein GMOLON4_401 [Gulosibacter molinativorax]